MREGHVAMQDVKKCDLSIRLVNATLSPFFCIAHSLARLLVICALPRVPGLEIEKNDSVETATQLLTHAELCMLQVNPQV